MTVLFGTVEYFEKELLRCMESNVFEKEDRSIAEIYKELHAELVDDFLCDEKLRIECLENLSNAYRTVSGW